MNSPPSYPEKVGQPSIFTGEETEVQCSVAHPTPATRIGTQTSGFPTRHS